MLAQPTDGLDQLLQLVVLLDDDMKQSLSREGLTVPRAHLAWLVHHNGPTTQRELAEALKVTPRNVTGLVDGLVATGFVTREQHPTDRRATLVALTERGAASLAEMDRGHRELATLLFGDMKGRELDAFVDALGHVTSRLREGMQAAGGGGR